MEANKQQSIAIIGTGFSGLCLAIHLKKIGHSKFTLFEKAERVGGTWRENIYPGSECDIPSALYSFSFEANPNWSRKWSEQAEILAYLERCAKKYDLYPHIKFRETCQALTFQEATQNWLVQTSSGTQTFDVVVSGVGQLHKVFTPKYEGAESFQGKQFHSAQWRYDVPLEGKTINVIGNAASAVQFIPQIVPKVKQLNVFQRSANWVAEKKDRKHFAIEKWLSKSFPFLGKIYRFSIWFMADYLFFQLMNVDGNKFLRKKLKQYCLHFMKKHVTDPVKQKQLTPDYPLGAKRILFSDDFYPAMGRKNVSIVTEAIKKIEADGIRTKDDKFYPCDVLIYATGFETSIFLTPMLVKGKNGVVLNDLWQKQGAEAYMGITHTGFPNFFMMYGPNTNLGHNSIIVMIEAQTRYILSCLENLKRNNAKTLDVKAPVQKDYNAWLQKRMENKVWNAVDHSWYKIQGKVTNNWVGRTAEYRKITREMKPGDYEFK